MGGPILRVVLPARLPPLLIPNPQSVERGSGLGPDRACGDVGQGFAGAANVGFDPCRRVHDFGRIENRVDRLLIARIGAPAVQRNDHASPAVVQRRERLADAGRTKTEPDVTVSPARVRELDETPMFKRFDEDFGFATRCSSA